MATAYSSSMLDGELPMMNLKALCSCQRIWTSQWILMHLVHWTKRQRIISSTKAMKAAPPTHRRAHRGRRGRRSDPQHGYPSDQCFIFAAHYDISGPADGGDPAASHPQNQKLRPNVPANSMAQPNTKFYSVRQLQPDPTPSTPPPSRVAIC